MADALAPLKVRRPQFAREREILRVSASMTGDDASIASAAARHEVLAWMQKRAVGLLPKEAWDHKSFEHLAGGRTSMGVRIKADDMDLWAIRTDDPDKHIPGRVWTTEVTVGFLRSESARLSLRLLISTTENELEIEPATPGCIQQISNACALLSDGVNLNIAPWEVDSASHVGRLINLLASKNRMLPVIVASGVQGGAHAGQPLIDTEELARTTLGLAHVVVLPARHTYALTDQFGKMRSVFNGAVRVYMPGFDTDAYPYDHRLFLSHSLSTEAGMAQCSGFLRRLAASESLKYTRLGHDVLSFSTVRSARLKLDQRGQSAEGQSKERQLESATKRIEALEQEIHDVEELLILTDDSYRAAEERAKNSEREAYISAHRIQQLISQLKDRGDAPDESVQLPAAWEEFSDWCDEQLIGRLVLASAARAGVKAPKFEDVDKAARCVLWLANEARDHRIAGGQGKFQDQIVLDGFRNSHCGNDAFDFEFRGERHIADWHVKNGGNTRDPRRCLRIYYAWEPNTQQIIVAGMPAHRRTGAS